MSLNLAHQNSYPEFVNHMSNETMIRQKYESMSQSDYSNHHPHHDNVEDYLNFGDNTLENYEHIHGVKQEDMECDFLQAHDLKNQMENGLGFEQNHLSFIQHQQNGTMIQDANFFIYKQQPLAQANLSSTANTGAGQSAPIQFDNSQLSAKMKRIMKREKAKSRRKMTLEQQQQQQQVASVQEAQFIPTIPVLAPQIPLIAQQTISQSNEDPTFFNKSVEFTGNQQQIEMRSCSTSCSSNSAQFEVKIEATTTNANSSSSANGKINPAHLLEQKLKKSTSSLSHEDLQLKALQQCSGNMDQKQQKKVMQMIRNRISAQNSRDRKKAYISKLEQDKEESQLEGVELRDQLNETIIEHAKEKQKNELLQKEIQELKKKLQNQCKCFHTNPDKMEQAQLSQAPFYPKHHNSLQKNYAAFSVAFFAVLGVVLIFNVKPSENEQAIINQSSQMMKMLDDLSKSNQDYQKMTQLRADKDEIGQVNASIISAKDYLHKNDLKEELSVSCHEDLHNQSMDEEMPSSSEQNTPFNLDMLSKHSSERIKKDQWIQFLVPKQDNSERDDVSRDSAETDVTHNGNQKYLQVWAQIKSVNEFEQEN